MGQPHVDSSARHRNSQDERLVVGTDRKRPKNPQGTLSMKRILAGILTVTVMGFVTWAGLRGNSERTRDPSPGVIATDTPEGRIRALLQSSRDGDDVAYLASFDEPMRTDRPPDRRARAKRFCRRTSASSAIAKEPRCVRGCSRGRCRLRRRGDGLRRSQRESDIPAFPKLRCLARHECHDCSRSTPPITVRCHCELPRPGRYTGQRADLCRRHRCTETLENGDLGQEKTPR